MTTDQTSLPAKRTPSPLAFPPMCACDKPQCKQTHVRSRDRADVANEWTPLVDILPYFDMFSVYMVPGGRPISRARFRPHVRCEFLARKLGTRNMSNFNVVICIFYLFSCILFLCTCYPLHAHENGKFSLRDLRYVVMLWSCLERLQTLIYQFWLIYLFFDTHSSFNVKQAMQFLQNLCKLFVAKNTNLYLILKLINSISK